MENKTVMLNDVPVGEVFKIGHYEFIKFTDRDGMDKLITGELGIEYYGRYMDDFYLIHPDKQYLMDCLNAITEYVKTLDLTLNAKHKFFR